MCRLGQSLSYHVDRQLLEGSLEEGLCLNVYQSPKEDATGYMVEFGVSNTSCSLLLANESLDLPNRNEP